MHNICGSRIAVSLLHAWIVTLILCKDLATNTYM